MVNKPEKLLGNSNTPQNNLNLTSKLDIKISKKKDKLNPKSRQQIYAENYQKNKEHKKQQRRERYQQDKGRIKAIQKQKYHQQKKQSQLTTKQIQSKYYGAEAIKVLMSFKEYTELNKEKKQLWLDFNWTAKDYQKSIEKGYADVVMIMKLEEVVHNLVRDYWDTAKSEEKQRSKSWNNLDYDKQQRLIRYWGYEKTRIENGYIEEEEKLERQSQKYLKEIELAKFHEERGKIKCPCYSCEEKKTISKEVKAKINKEMNQVEDYWGGTDKKEECPNCGKIRVLDEENGLCKKCSESYED